MERRTFDGLSSEYVSRVLPDLLTSVEKEQIDLAITEMNRRRLPVIPETRVWLAHELVSTRQTFESFGLRSDDLPSKFPLVDQILEPNTPLLTRRELPLIIEIAGTPSSDKSHLVLEGRREDLPYHGIIERVHDAKGVKSHSFSILEVLQNVATSFGQLNRPNPIKDESVIFEEAKRRLNNDVDRIMKDMRRGKIRKMPIVHERWAVDQRIFAQARFLMGQISYEAFRFFGDPFKTLKNITEFDLPFSNDYALILCVSSVQSSLNRIGDKTGGIMNQKFLETCYQQYIKFHLQMINSSRAVDYVCLDTSSADNRTVVNKFSGAISKLISKHRHRETYSEYNQPAK